MDFLGAIGKLLGSIFEDKKKKPQQVQQPSQLPQPAQNNSGMVNIAGGNRPQVSAPQVVKPKLTPSVNTAIINAPKPPSLQPEQPKPVVPQPVPQVKVPNGNTQPSQQPSGPTVNDVGNFIANGTAKLANTGLAIGEKVGVHAQGGIQKLLGDQVGGNRTIQQGEQSINQRLLRPGGGLFGAGGIYNSLDQLHNADTGDVIRKAGGTGLQAASELLPIGSGLKVAKSAAPLAQKVISGAIQGAAGSGVGSAGAQLAQNGNVDVGQVAMGAVTGSVLGGGTAGIATSLGKAIQRVRESNPRIPNEPMFSTSRSESLQTSVAPRPSLEPRVQKQPQIEQPRPLSQESAPILRGTYSTDSRAQVLPELRKLAHPAQPSNNRIPSSTQSIPELPVNGVKKVGNIDKIFRSTRSIIERQGNSGKELANGLQSARNTQEIYLGQLQKAMPTVTKLARPKAIGKNSWTNKDFENFVDAAQGAAPAKNATVAKAVEEWKAVHPEIRNRAVNAGLDVGDLGPDYYPHFVDYDKVLKDKDKYNQAINHLVQTGQANSQEDAIKLLGYAQEVSRNREFGNLEASRIVDLPFYDKTPNSFISYLNGSAKRIAHTETFGAKDENALKLISKIGLEGGDTEAAKNAFDVAVGAKKYNPNTEKASANIRKYVSTTRLGLGALTNISQNVNTGIVTGHLRTMAAMLKQLNPKTREFVQDTGVISDALLNDLRTQSGFESFTSKVLGKAVNKVTAPFFGNVEKFNRAVSATAGRDYALRLAQRGDEKTLRKLGVTGEIKGRALTEEQQVQAARKVVEKTQFKVDPQDLPGWTDSPGGKLVAQFRTFSYAQGKFVSNEILKPAAKGNFLPLGRLLAALPIGYGLYETRRLIDGRPEEEDKSKVALQSFGKVGGAGLAFDIYNALNPIGSKYLPADRRTSMAVGAFGGPAAGQAASLLGGISEAIQGKNIPTDESRLDGKVAVKNSDGETYNDLTPITRFGLQQVPIIGSATANRLLPYKQLSEADSGNSSNGSGVVGAIKQLNKDEKQKNSDLKKAVGNEAYSISTLNDSEKQQLLDNGVLTQDQVDQANAAVDAKKKELGITSTKKKSNYADKYAAAQKEFSEKSSDWSVVEKAKKQKELNKLAVQKDFDSDTVDLYNMSKQDVYDLVSKDSDGNKKVKDILAYGDALVAAGQEKTNKYRDKYGNVKLADGKASSSGSGKKKGKGKKAKKISYKNSFSRVGSTAAIRKLLQQSGKGIKA